MFTGIIEELGRLQKLERRGHNAHLTVEAQIVTSDLKEGDSVAVNGVCLTAVEAGRDYFSADVSAETLERSTFGPQHGALRSGVRLNLERAVTPNTRLGGHIVQGHTDGHGTFRSVVNKSESWTVEIGFPPELARYLVEKGSVTVDGISLTIARLASDSFNVAIVPKTWNMTNLKYLRHSDRVNLEVDIIAKYIERIMTIDGARGSGKDVSLLHLK